MKQNTAILRKVTATFVGEELSKSAIELLVAKADPTQNIGSLNISDHAAIKIDGKLAKQPSQARQYADLIFEKIGSGRYRVLSATEVIPEPPTMGRGYRGLSDADKLKAAQAELDALTAKQAKQTGKPATPAVPVAVAATANKSNGAATSAPQGTSK